MVRSVCHDTLRLPTLTDISLLVAFSKRMRNPLAALHLALRQR